MELNMLSKKELFHSPSGEAIYYQKAISDVREQMKSLLLKQTDPYPEEYKKAWNQCLIELSKKIKLYEN